jgi:hypothetical protein
VLSGQVQLTANASDSGSGVQSVQFFVNGGLLGTATAAGGSSYAYSWNTTAAANGSHVLTAVARDLEGNQSTSTQVAISIQNIGPDLRTGLVGHWALNQTNGTTVLDGTDNANHGSLANGVLYVSAQHREGLSFDGADDYVRIPNSSAIDRSFPISVSAWVKPEVNGGWQSVVTKLVAEGTHGSPFSAYDITLLHDSTGFKPWFAVTGSGGNRVYATSQAAYSYSSWRHIVGTYDGSTVRLYVDGAQAATASLSSAIAQYAQPLYLGVNGARNDQFKGVMDDVRVYARVLSSSEIQALFNAETPITPTATVTAQ